jgi:AmpD protein
MYSFDPDSGTVSEARQVASPNCDARPSGCEPELIVVHGISLPPQEYGGPWIDRLFTNCLDCSAHPYFEALENLQVSAHFLLRRDGELVQYVSTRLRAWHAGQSSHQGRERCNDYSIGIELEGDDTTPYTDVQYRNLAGLIRTLRSGAQALNSAEVVGHCDIAPGRKTDPGPAFNWQRLNTMLADVID